MPRKNRAGTGLVDRVIVPSRNKLFVDLDVRWLYVQVLSGTLSNLHQVGFSHTDVKWYNLSIVILDLQTVC